MDEGYSRLVQASRDRKAYTARSFVVRAESHWDRAFEFEKPTEPASNAEAFKQTQFDPPIYHLNRERFTEVVAAVPSKRIARRVARTTWKRE